MGVVKIEYAIAVDLDNKSMVERAKDNIVSDIENAVKMQELDMWLEEQELAIDESEIPDYLLEEEY
jgi:hypothetical protein